MYKVIVLLAAWAITGNVSADAKAAWGYSGSGAPEHWAQLSHDNFACSGSNQSPINLTGFIKSQLTPIVFDYQAGGDEIINNGHTVQVNYQPGSSIEVDGQRFKLLQFHFHAPSENHINGQSHPLEAHFVHADTNAHLAVVAVMFSEGVINQELQKAWAELPKHKGDKRGLAATLSATKLLPKSKSYYRFNGSLTTPPCSEGVRWLVMKQIVSASSSQIAAFAAVLHEPNNRPIQALNARMVLK